MNNQEELIEENQATTGSFNAVEYFENNKKNILLVVGALVILAIAYIGYKEFVVKPKEKEGMVAIKDVQKYYGLDSFKMVINSNDFPNAIVLADDYSGTKAGELANFYAGTSYLQLGDFEGAIEYLEKVNFNDKVLKYQTIGALGDAYVETADLEKGLSNYKKAAKGLQGQLASTYYFKAGGVMAKLGQYSEAASWYKDAKVALEGLPEAQKIDFNIAQMEAKAKE